MLNKYSRYRVLRVFLQKPTESFGLREIGRLSKLSPPSVIKYLKEFELDGLIIKTEKKGIPSYQAAKENEDFIFYKKVDILYELHSSGLVDYLWQKLGPNAIILYGSHAKGEAAENSDIDIFIIGKDKDIVLAEFEKKLGREIHLMFDNNVKNIPSELKNNLINGIILKGYFKVF
ncbi:MAG: nucleotidyltransferase domain-containing protein [Nanoarchaeota archaeon]